MPQAAIPYILSASAVAGAATSIQSAQEGKKANRFQRRIAEGEAASERRKIVREERIRRAQIINAAAQTGTSGSSSAQSAVGGLGIQAGQNLGQSFSTQALSNRASNASQRSVNYSTASSIFGQVGQVAGLFQQ